MAGDPCFLHAIWRDSRFWDEVCMTGRIALAAACAVSCLLPQASIAQDVPGIEICTVEKTMERRTSCLQSNVDFLQKTITKLSLDNQRRIDAASRQIDALKANVTSLEKLVEEQKKTIEEIKKAATAPAKDAAPAAKEGAK
jgi:tRNA uridine 5-carbamoylmethylation protein Kti12